MLKESAERRDRVVLVLGQRGVAGRRCGTGMGVGGTGAQGAAGQDQGRSLLVRGFVGQGPCWHPAPGIPGALRSVCAADTLRDAGITRLGKQITSRTE